MPINFTDRGGKQAVIERTETGPKATRIVPADGSPANASGYAKAGGTVLQDIADQLNKGGSK